jgi:hypothetical protein
MGFFRDFLALFQQNLRSDPKSRQKKIWLRSEPESRQNSGGAWIPKSRQKFQKAENADQTSQPIIIGPNHTRQQLFERRKLNKSATIYRYPNLEQWSHFREKYLGRCQQHLINSQHLLSSPSLKGA